MDTETPTTKRKISLNLLGILISFSAFTANATPISTQQLQHNSFVLGVAARNAPKYSGSNDYKWSTIPIIQARLHHFFIDTTKGIGYDLALDNGLYWEQSLGYRFKRNDSNSKWGTGSNHLRGMGKIPAALTTSATIGYQITPWLWSEITATIALNHNQGITYSPTLAARLPIDKQNMLSSSVRLMMATEHYTQLYYGVNQSQSTNSGFARYNTAGGLYGSQINLQWTHFLSEQLASSVGISYTRLADKVADSQVVQNANQYAATLAMSYSF
ncbi:MAG: hypothetical protein CENE_02561 [Candidatus Celerinatantimonas neptuna]|nr:MAG: hypothetical protein CENE_02561 [Candidatus Celerinatantimonas neptuna]